MTSWMKSAAARRFVPIRALKASATQSRILVALDFEFGGRAGRLFLRELPGRRLTIRIGSVNAAMLTTLLDYACVAPRIYQPYRHRSLYDNWS